MQLLDLLALRGAVGLLHAENGAGRRGPRLLQAYRRSRGTILFQHCKMCGCVVFYEGRENKGEEARIAVNARMLPFEEIAGVRIKQLDGAHEWASWEDRTHFDLSRRWTRPSP